MITNQEATSLRAEQEDRQWGTALPSKVNLLHAIYLRDLRGAYLVTIPKIGGNERLELH